MTIYVDVVLIENICMNYIILFGTSYIMKIKRKHIRLFLSSTIGAVYAVLAYAEIVPLYANFIVKVVLSIVMVFVAFYPKRFKGLFKELIVFYLVSFALGGCAFALLYIVRPQDIFMKNGVYIGTYPLKIALLGGIVGFVITYIAFKVVKNKIAKNQIIYEVEIVIDDKTLKTQLLLDTGNMLKDPISNSPVLVVEKSVLKEIIPEEVLEETNIPDQIGSWNLSIEERFQLIINAYKQLRDDYERGIKISEGEGDDSTNDLLISYHTAIEKRIWMMSAELGQRPGEGE